MNIEEQFQQVEQKYGLVLPEAYRSMQAAGWLDVNSPDPLYLWLLGAKWLPLAEVLEHEPEDYQKPGFVPFAAEADGSHWCWWPEVHPGMVVMCPRDCYDGEFYAASFLGFVYRRLLDYAGCVLSQEDQEARHYLHQSTARLADYFPDAWIETLNTLASAEPVQWRYGKITGRGFLTYEQKQEIIRRDLSFPLLDQEFQWMYPLSGEEEETAALWRRVLSQAGPIVPFAEKLAQVEAEKAKRKSAT